MALTNKLGSVYELKVKMSSLPLNNKTVYVEKVCHDNYVSMYSFVFFKSIDYYVLNKTV